MSEYIGPFLEHLGPILVGLFGFILSTLAVSLSKKFGNKIDVETRARFESLLSDVIEEGVTYAEQWAKNEGHRLQSKVPSQSKMNKALEYVANEIERNSFPQLAEQVIRNKIESALGVLTIEEQQNISALLGEVDDEDFDNI